MKHAMKRAMASALVLAAAMSLEALRGTRAAYDERISRIRPHPGQLATSGNLPLQRLHKAAIPFCQPLAAFLAVPQHRDVLINPVFHSPPLITSRNSPALMALPLFRSRPIHSLPVSAIRDGCGPPPARAGIGRRNNYK